MRGGCRFVAGLIYVCYVTFALHVCGCCYVLIYAAFDFARFTRCLRCRAFVVVTFTRCVVCDYVCVVVVALRLRWILHAVYVTFLILRLLFTFRLRITHVALALDYICGLPHVHVCYVYGCYALVDWIDFALPSGFGWLLRLIYAFTVVALLPLPDCVAATRLRLPVTLITRVYVLIALLVTHVGYGYAHAFVYLQLVGYTRLVYVLLRLRTFVTLLRLFCYVYCCYG